MNRIVDGLIWSFLIFIIPVLVVFALFAAAEGTTSPGTTPLSVALVVIGWVVLLGLYIRREWNAHE